ncbi:MAG: hypothetical protein KF851_04540 [Pirellulaceae bacterium]|jgi:alkylhydroperoxidase family enzyme|nr:hypothetical protein [Pirellulaceae bacterium]
MKPMYLSDVETKELEGAVGDAIKSMENAGLPVPQIRYLFNFRAHTQHLMAFTQGVMRGPSPLSPGLRELIAAYTSRRNDCLF